MKILTKLFLFVFVGLCISSCFEGNKKAPDLSRQDKINAFVRGAENKINPTLPLDQGNGMVMTEFHYNAGYLIYTIECDEDYYDMEEMRKYKADNKEYLLGNVRELLPPATVNGMKELNIGCEYRFVGTESGMVCSIRIESDEL